MFQDPAVYDQTDLQCIWMEITPPKSKGFILCSCYRPPNVDNEQAYVVGLRNMLTEVADCGKEIVITGDLNFDLKQSNKPASTKRFINMTNLVMSSAFCRLLTNTLA